MSSHNRNPESGYALLLVFAMAAIVAITLYTQVPRVAFEAQRDKEDLLMSRGHEYIRAITLYVHKFNRFPASMDELENTNNIRFLRRRYADPMTGKTDWRLLHAGPGGVITDSILNNKKDAAATQQTFITELQMFGATPPASQEDGVNLATRKRASDQPGAAGDPSMSGGGNLNNSNGGNLNLSPANPIVGNNVYNGPVMVLPDGSIVPANTTGTAPLPGAPPAGVPPGMPGIGIPGAPGFSGGLAMQPNPVSQNGQNTPPLPSQLAPPNGAASLINQLLTSPRPGGFNGLGGTPGAASPTTASSLSPPTSTTGTPTTGTGTPAGQQVVGAGLAGVASQREQQGIKSYNQRTKYNEWEFIYDITKDPTKTAQVPGGMPGAAGSSGAQGGSGGTSPSSTPSSTGNGLGPGTSNPMMPNPMMPGNPTTPPVIPPSQ